MIAEELCSSIKMHLEEGLGCVCEVILKQEMYGQRNMVRIKAENLILDGSSGFEIEFPTGIQPEFIIDEILFKAIDYRIQWTRDNREKAEKFVYGERKEKIDQIYTNGSFTNAYTADYNTMLELLTKLQRRI